MLPLGRSSALTASPDNSFPSSSSSYAAAVTEETDFETYLLLLLSDSNLPTGGFVASSGLESFYAHGLLHNARPTPPSSASSFAAATPTTKPRQTAPSQARLSSATLSFARSTLHSYSRSSFPFLARAHACVEAYLTAGVRARADRGRVRKLELPEERIAADEGFEEAEKVRLEACLKAISHLDYSYHTLLLNHVARRASKAQGIALLTLYAKAFAKPINLEKEAFGGATTSPHSPDTASPNTAAGSESDEKSRIELAARLIDTLKLEIRRSTSTSTSTPSTSAKATQQNGHLPICWAVFSACLGISLRKAVFLHLFLQARSLFSSSIRLNTLGPYLAHQIMRFQMRGVVEDVIREMEREGCLTVESGAKKEGNGDRERDEMEVDQTAEAEEAVAYTVDWQIQAASGDRNRADGSADAEALTSATTLRSRTGKPFRTTSTMSSTTATYSKTPLKLRSKVQSLRIGKGQLIPVRDDDPSQGWAWDWPEEQDTAFEEDQQDAKDSERGFWTSPSAPATTFPLGEIIQARHDQLHSRLFNS